MKKLFIRFRACLPVILIVGVLLIPNVGFAQAALDPGSDTLKGLADLLGVIISVLTFLALLMINFFGDLLGTAMITGPAAMDAIQPMWMWVRNLTNILFVGVLLFLAFSNLFSSLGVGGEGGNWTIKEKLPKLIIAIVAINFSLLGFKVVIDAINVGTVAILGIADHKLEPDTSGITKILDGTHTWIKTDTTRRDLLIGDGDDKLKEKDIEETGIEGNKDAVSGGNDCGKEWEMMGKIDGCAMEDGKEKCLLTATKGSDVYVCRGFRESINDLFCRDWVKSGDDYQNQVGGDDKCLFMMTDNSFSSIVTPKSEPGQNLFATFGSVFMHLEKLPALGAEINSLGAVVTNTLFSAILAIAFIVALVAVFIAMIARVILLWVVLVFSPLLVGASILGVDGGAGGDISGKIVTHLIMPLKVAAAFAVGFVMMSAMIEWPAQAGKEATFIFGPALSQLGVNEYAFLWQIATIVLFWMVAFWAVEGSLADKLVQGVKSAAEIVATTTAKSLTVDRPMFSVGTGSEKAEFSLGSVLQMPEAIANAKQTRDNQMRATMAQAFGITQSDFEQGLLNKRFNSADDFKNYHFSAGSIGEASSHWKDEVSALRKSTFPGAVALANLIEQEKGDWNKIQSTIAASPADYGYTTNPYFSTPSSYGKTYTGDTPEPAPAEEKIKGKEGNVAIEKAEKKNEANTITVKGMDNKEKTENAEEVFKNTKHDDDIGQVATAVTKGIKEGMILTSGERGALGGNEGLLGRTLKANKGGFFPSLNDDSSALEVEVINPEGKAEAPIVVAGINANEKWRDGLDTDQIRGIEKAIESFNKLQDK